MALASLLSSAQSWEELSTWSLAHALDHDEIDIALIAHGKVASPLSVPLDPLPPPEGIPDWLFRHQLKHTEMCDALGVATSDMSSYDLTTNEGVQSFIGANFSEHNDVHFALGI